MTEVGSDDKLSAACFCMVLKLHAMGDMVMLPVCLISVL